MWKACVLDNVMLILYNMYAWAEKRLRQWRGMPAQPHRKIYVAVTELAVQGIRFFFSDA
jgi:hypothetical protein